MAFTYILSMIFYGFFFTRAMRNLRETIPEHVNMKPHGMWFWHFIPVLNLYMPYYAMLQAWRGSHKLAGRDAGSAAYLGGWWAAWLLSGFTSGVAIVLYESGIMLGSFADDASRLALALDTASDVLFVIAAVLLLLIAERIYRLQSQYQQSLAASAP